MYYRRKGTANLSLIILPTGLLLLPLPDLLLAIPELGRECAIRYGTVYFYIVSDPDPDPVSMNPCPGSKI
jgi:hypothetical protein